MKKLGKCVICGEEEAVTRDHIPPKSIFVEPRPTNLITVPACRMCNNGSSQLDERFKVYLGLHVSKAGTGAEKLFQASRKSTEHNEQLYREIFSKLEPTYLATKNGIIYDKGYRILWDSNAHDKVIERMIRGLYYHHFKSILGNKVKIKTYWFSELSSAIDTSFANFNTGGVGQGEFIYKFGKSKQNSLYSLWLFQFYKSHWAGGCTVPLNEDISINCAGCVDSI